jgi:hypothetical protein
MMARITTDSVRNVYKTHREEHRDKRKEFAMRGITVGVTLAIVVLVAALSLPTQRIGAQPAEKFDLEKAITGVKTLADHEAIASPYDKESATAAAGTGTDPVGRGRGGKPVEEAIT